jgi:hypothetical protein
MRGPHLHAAHFKRVYFFFAGVAFSLILSLTHSAWGYFLVAVSEARFLKLERRLSVCEYFQNP